MISNIHEYLFYRFYKWSETTSWLDTDYKDAACTMLTVLLIMCSIFIFQLIVKIANFTFLFEYISYVQYFFLVVAIIVLLTLKKFWNNEERVKKVWQKYASESDKQALKGQQTARILFGVIFIANAAISFSFSYK